MSSAPDWPTRFEAILRDRLGPDGSHDIGHFRRVWRMVEEISAEEGGDREVLVAAAWFHDLVNPPKHSPDRARASALSAEAAVPILLAEGYPEQKLPAVQHAITAHSFSAGITPETLEARILQDADRLDALGAIGIARTFYVAGRMGSSLFHPDDPLASNRTLDDRAFSLGPFRDQAVPDRRDHEHRYGPAHSSTSGPTLMRTFVRDLIAEI